MRQLSILLLGVTLAGCGGALAAFDTQFPDNVRSDVSRALAEMGPAREASRPANALGKPIVVAAVFGRNTLFAYDLAAGRRLWERPGRVDSRPLIGARVVVYVSGPDIVALFLETGAELWRLPREGRTFRGAAADDSGVYITLGEPEPGAATTSSSGRSILIGVDAESGAVRFRHEVDHMVAAPGAVHGVVAVPWDRQNLSMIDGHSGDEIARVRSTDDVLTFAIGTSTGLYYGSGGVYHLTPRSVAGNRRDAPYYRPSIDDLPGEPMFGDDGYQPQVEGRNARERIRFHWAPAPGPEGIAFGGGAVYLLYYRYLFAFAAESAAPRWVYRHPADIGSVSVTSGGIVLADDDGGVALLDLADGLPRWRGSLGAPILAATFDAEGFAPPAGSTEEDPGLRRRLLDVVFDQDNRLAPARAFAVRLLAKLEAEEITGDLIEIAGRRSLAQPIRTAAAQQILERRSGGHAVVEALGRRHSFLDGTEAPPSGMLARAAASMSLRDAVPGLIRHLQSHETEASALPDIVSAIVQLGDRSASAPLRDFVVRYHADDVLGDSRSALALAAAGALRLGGAEEIEAMRRVGEDPFCLPEVAAAIRETLPEVAPRAETATPETPETPPETPQTPPEQGPTRFLTDAQVQEALAEQYGEMRDCVLRNRQGPSPPARVRMVFILFADGHAERTTISPPNEAAGQCLAEILATIPFPRIVEERQQVTYWLQIRAPSIPAGGGRGAAPTPDANGGAPAAPTPAP